MINIGETIDDTDIVHLTDHPERDEHPAWSPDGSQLAFSSQRGGVDDIYIMDADGSGSAVNLSSSSARKSFPFRSPVD